jgi:hypothetical protein
MIEVHMDYVSAKVRPQIVMANNFHR